MISNFIFLSLEVKKFRGQKLLLTSTEQKQFETTFMTFY